MVLITYLGVGYLVKITVRLMAWPSLPKRGCALRTWTNCPPTSIVSVLRNEGHPWGRLEHDLLHFLLLSLLVYFFSLCYVLSSLPVLSFLFSLVAVFLAFGKTNNLGQLQYGYFSATRSYGLNLLLFGRSMASMYPYLCHC